MFSGRNRVCTEWFLDRCFSGVFAGEVIQQTGLACRDAGVHMFLPAAASRNSCGLPVVLHPGWWLVLVVVVVVAHLLNIVLHVPHASCSWLLPQSCCLLILWNILLGMCAIARQRNTIVLPLHGAVVQL